jgi:hypothetical protein
VQRLEEQSDVAAPREGEALQQQQADEADAQLQEDFFSGSDGEDVNIAQEEPAAVAQEEAAAAGKKKRKVDMSNRQPKGESAGLWREGLTVHLSDAMRLTVHLSDAMRLYRCQYNVESFPYGPAIDRWRAAKNRYGLRG